MWKAVGEPWSEPEVTQIEHIGIHTKVYVNVFHLHTFFIMTLVK